MLKLQAVDAGDADAVMRALAERLDRAQARLDRCDRLRTRMLRGRATRPTTCAAFDRIGPYLRLMGGRMLEQQNIRWITTVMDILAER